MLTAQSTMPSDSINSIGSLLSSYFRCPEIDAEFALPSSLSANPGYFRLNGDLLCYGRVAGAQPASAPAGSVPEVVIPNGGEAHVSLPFNPAEAIDNLRFERYASKAGGNSARKKLVRKAYYFVRPLMPVAVRKHLQRVSLSGWDQIQFPQWSVDRTADKLHEILLAAAMHSAGVSEMPFIWFWPDGHRGAATVTHDVETETGRDFCGQLMDINDSFGIKTAFQVVPEKRYEVPVEYLESIRSRGFEVNVHDLNHDGKLFTSRELFQSRVKEINRYGREFKARGFRAAVLYRNLEWMDSFDFAYDMSVPNVAHLDPQRGGCCTVMPFFVGDVLEIPVTATQDYSLFHILNDYSMDLWSRQIATITQAHGLASFIVHPDYIIEANARSTYEQLLEHLAEMRTKDHLWIALPGEINDWWRSRAKMRLRHDATGWRIEGNNCERARIAYARLESGRIAYDMN